MIRNIEYCVLDESIWIHGLKECDGYNLPCIDALKLLGLFRDCPKNVKLILNMNYQQTIIEKLKKIKFKGKKSSSNFLSRFRYLYPLIASDPTNKPSL